MASNKLAYLDGLRGLASLWVTFSHSHRFLFYREWARSVAIDNDPYYRLMELFSRGPIPVAIFFMLSGRVIALSLMKSRLDPDTPSTYQTKFRKLCSMMFRRPIRLLMPTICAAWSFWAIVYFFDGFNTPMKDKANRYFPEWGNDRKFKLKTDLWVYIKKSIGITLFNQMENVPHWYQVEWTIHYEFYNSYWVFTLAAIGTLMKPAPRIFIFALLCVVVYYYLDRDMYLSDFIFGLILAEVSELGGFKIFLNAKGRFFRVFVKILPWVMLAGFFIANMYVYPMFKSPIKFYHTSATLILLAVEISPELQYLLSLPFPIFLGKISFGLYLLHSALTNSLCTWLVPFVVGTPTPKKKKPESWVYAKMIIVMICVFFYFSWIFYKTADKWSIKIGKYLDSLLLNQKPGGNEIKKKFDDFCNRTVMDHFLTLRVKMKEFGWFWFDVLVWCWVDWLRVMLVDVIKVLVLIKNCMCGKQTVFKLPSFLGRKNDDSDSLKPLLDP